MVRIFDQARGFSRDPNCVSATFEMVATATLAAHAMPSGEIGVQGIRRLAGRFLSGRERSKAALRAVVRLLAQHHIDAVLFGGAVRDLALGIPRPRDVDIVVRGAELDMIRSALSRAGRLRSTRFGGLHWERHGWMFDIWRLEDTWAIRQFHWAPVDFSLLPRTTFFNIEAIAIDLTSSKGQKRSVYESGFFDAMSTRTLDINLEANPFPALCVIRTLVMSLRLEFFVSRRLAEYIVKHGRSEGIHAVIAAQRSHYGRVHLREADISYYLNAIEDQLTARNLSLVRLPTSVARQLELW
jgi:hypothetical protein